MQKAKWSLYKYNFFLYSAALGIVQSYYTFLKCTMYNVSCLVIITLEYQKILLCLFFMEFLVITFVNLSQHVIGGKSKIQIHCIARSIGTPFFTRHTILNLSSLIRSFAYLSFGLPIQHRCLTSQMRF